MIDLSYFIAHAICKRFPRGNLSGPAGTFTETGILQVSHGGGKPAGKRGASNTLCGLLEVVISSALVGPSFFNIFTLILNLS